MVKRTLKSIRLDLGLTQDQMAKKLGISKISWMHKESYETKLSAVELMKIVNLSGVEASSIKIE